MNLSYDVVRLLQGKTISTAESCTGGGIGYALTSVPGSSDVFKGGIISYTNEVKAGILGVDPRLLESVGAVSAEVAGAMADGVRRTMRTDIGISVTGLAGPGGDTLGTQIGTVYIGYSEEGTLVVKSYIIPGNRETVRHKAIEYALALILEANS